MAGVDPALSKDPLLFPFQDVRIGEHPAVDAKQPVLVIIADQTFRRTIFHSSSLLWRSCGEGLCDPLPETCSLRSPRPVAGHRAGIDTQIRAGDHLSIVRR